MNHDLPIGVFDSGVGGLTVLRALRARLPGEQFIYLGDTARLPYGTKTGDSVLRYSIQAAGLLATRGIKYLVVACNTASSVAVGELRRRLEPIPVVGVIEPGAQAGCAATHSGHIGVLATEGTVRGRAYHRAIENGLPQSRVAAIACGLLVALAEEGWTDGPIVEAVARHYLDHLFREAPRVDTVLLGCTHFPVFKDTLQSIVGPAIAIVDSAETTATAVAVDLHARGLLRTVPDMSSLCLLATEGPERFARIGSRFLGETLDAGTVELVDVWALKSALTSVLSPATPAVLHRAPSRLNQPALKLHIPGCAIVEFLR